MNYISYRLNIHTFIISKKRKIYTNVTKCKTFLKKSKVLEKSADNINIRKKDKGKWQKHST